MGGGGGGREAVWRLLPILCVSIFFQNLSSKQNRQHSCLRVASHAVVFRGLVLETLSIDDGNGNGDGKTEERLRRGRGCVAKLETVKQAQYDDSFPRRGLTFHSPKIFDLNFRKFRSRMERAYSRSVSTFREQLKRLS